jgi:hypothetical protein
LVIDRAYGSNDLDRDDGENVAQYKYAYLLTSSSNPRFDHIHAPGVAAPYAGIFRCHGCGREVALKRAEQLPPQDDHQHTPSQGTIRWRLAVAAQS